MNIKKLKLFIKKVRLFYLKDIKKKDYFTITVNGKISSYVFLKYRTNY